MQKKTILIVSSLILVLGLVIVVPSVGAQDTNTRQAATSDVAKRGSDLIQKRIDLLNQAIERLKGDKRVTEEQKAGLIRELQASIDSLTALRQRLANNQDQNAAREEAKEIFTKHKVYQTLLPKVQLLKILNNMLSVVTNLQNLIPQLQIITNKLSNEGKDTTNINTLLADINTQINIIIPAIARNSGMLTSLTPASENSSDILSQVRSDIQNTIKPAFQQIRIDIAQMRPVLKELIARPGVQPGASQSATPSSSTQ